MMKRVFGILCGVAAVSMAAPALAQSKVGLSATSESSIGLHIAASDKVAIRPAISFGHASVETKPATGATTTSSSTQFGLGVGLNFYMAEKDKLRSYFSPMYTWTRTSASTTGVTSVDPVTAHSVAGSIGAEYGISTHFSAFGEVGLAYSRSKVTSLTNSTATSTGIGTRAAVGVNWFWN